MTEETRDETYERGKREGGIDAKLDEHSRHLATVNGSIERSAIALENVAKEVRELGVKFDTQAKTAGAATKALADETERRRKVLAEAASNDDRAFSKRDRLTMRIIGFAGLCATVYFSINH